MRLLPLVLTTSLALTTLTAPASVALNLASATQASANSPERIAGQDRFDTSKAVAHVTGLESVYVSSSSIDAPVASLAAAHDNKSAILSDDAEPLGGENRYESAANVALDGERNAPLVLANDTSMVDVLSAASFAALTGGNLLLTGKTQLNKHTAAAMKELDPSKLTVIGGTGVVSDRILEQAQKATGVNAQRIWGKNRYETALQVAKATGAKNYLLVNGTNPVDALTLAPLSKQRKAAVLLVQRNCVPRNVLRLTAGKKTTIIGGSSAIADNYAAKTCEQLASEKATAARAAAQKARIAAQQAAALAAAANPYGAGTPRGIAYDLLDDYGWGRDQMGALDALWTRESGWNTRAGRAGGPYGIPQANPGSKMGAFGADWATNPETQIRWGLSYIKGRYGSPAAAWGNFQRRGWY